jgi:hypothetical protein
MKAITPQNYSKKVHCTECGQLFPTNKTEVLAVGKTVLRLCLKDYKPKKQSVDSAMFAAEQKSKELTETAAKNIASKGKER